MRKLTLAVLLLAACHRVQVPREEFLFRLDAPWSTPRALQGQGVRSAPATIVYFREDHEYFELHFTAIEQNDQAVYVSSNLPHASALGQWKQNGDSVEVTRRKISRADIARFLCGPLTFHISGHSVTGNAGGRSEGMYAPMTRLVAPDFQTYLKEAHQSPFSCPAVKQ